MMRVKGLTKSIPLSLSLLLVGGCGLGDAPDQVVVVVYTSVDAVFARPIAEQFEKDTGIRVQLVPDTEETKSTGLLNRLIAEQKRPQADVFWSGDPVRAAVLKLEEVSARYESPVAEGLPAEFSDPESHWTGFSARARLSYHSWVSHWQSPSPWSPFWPPPMWVRCCFSIRRERRLFPWLFLP